MKNGLTIRLEIVMDDGRIFASFGEVPASYSKISEWFFHQAETWFVEINERTELKRLKEKYENQS